MSARKIIWLLLSLALWLGALTGVHGNAAVQLRWNEAIGRTAVERALGSSDRAVRVAVWDMRSFEELTVAIYAGDPLLLTGGQMSSGSAAVCAVSESVARQIWGSIDVAGLTLALDGKKHIVGGVYPCGVADVIIASKGVIDTPFRRMAVHFEGQPDGAQHGMALDFAQAMGLAAPDEVLDAPLLYGMARKIAHLPGWMLIVLLAAWQWRALCGYRWMRLSIIAISVCGLTWAMGVSLTPPRWLLPSRWSDFGHWEALLFAVRGRVSSYLSAPHDPLNSQDLYTSARVIAQGILSTALLYDIGGGWDHAQDMDHTDAHRGAVHWKLRARRNPARGAGAEPGTARRVPD